MIKILVLRNLNNKKRLVSLLQFNKNTLCSNKFSLYLRNKKVFFNTHTHIRTHTHTYTQINTRLCEKKVTVYILTSPKSKCHTHQADRGLTVRGNTNCDSTIKRGKFAAL